MLTKKIDLGIIRKKLKFNKGANIDAVNDDGTTTTISIAELVALNDLGATDLAKIDGITNGTVAASKAVVVDANKDASAFRNVTVTNLDAGASGTAGTVDVFPTTASKGKLAVTCTDQTGDTTVSLVAGAMAAARTITLRDPGAAASILTTTDSTAAATDATAVEITQTCDDSARFQAAGGTLTLTVASHNKKVVKLDTASGSVVTLPAATGSGAMFRFVQTVVPTSNSHIVKVANASDTMRGFAVTENDTDASTSMFMAGATDDTITFNRTTTGGTVIGEYIEVEDIATNLWHVRVFNAATGTEATPFSATV